ncbi:MAG: polysaccharide deacetylase family protein [Elusimicrobiaceae bacterium]|nr:polysaccharide deacetylase family protein [Elusimicrobiaceae bacterium]
MNALPVLMYHHIADDREVSVKQFAAQLAALKAAGWHAVTLAQALGHITGARPLAGRNCLITFDDGYADNWICAYPVLKAAGMRATVFVSTARITDGPVRPAMAQGAPCPVTARGEREPEGFLSWPELKIMAESGVFEVGGHTHTHKNFDKEAAYADLPGELAQSARLIGEKLRVKPLAMAWPWGVYEPGWPALAAQAGYKLVFTTAGGSNFPGGNPLELCRFKVKCGDAGWLLRRMAVYSTPVLGDLYGKVYGLDSKLKHKLLAMLRA